MIDLDWNPTRETLRRFGWIALGGFSLIALLAWNEWLVFSFGLGAARSWVAGSFLVLGLVSALLSAVAPNANRPIFLGLSLVAFPIGFVLSYLILGILFYGLITPVGLVMRLIGRDTMKRRFEPDASSYWTDPRPQRAKESYFRQF